MHWLRFSTRFTALALGSVLTLATYCEIRYRGLKSKFTLGGQGVVWAHRGGGGTASKLPENSIAALKWAQSHGAQGIEIDIHYDADGQDFTLSHDEPVATTSATMTKLSTYAAAADPNLPLWLDFKNLFPENAKAAAATLRRIFSIRPTGVQLIVVEGTHIGAVRILANEGFTTSLWTAVPRHVSATRQILSALLWRWRLGWYEIPALSMAWEHYSSTLERAPLVNTPILLFTINDAVRMAEFAQKPNVRLLLTDEPNLYRAFRK